MSQCEWCESVGPTWPAADGGGEQLCAECIAAMIPEDVDVGAKHADAAVARRQTVNRSTVRALQFKARSGALVMPFGRETVRARVRPR